MAERASTSESLGRRLRALWATIAIFCLLGAAAAYGVTWYNQGQLERDATRDDHKLAVDMIQPMLIPADAEGPIRGTRYDELLASMQQSVLAGPINGVRLWGADGTILFADEPALVGRRDPQMRDDIHAALAGTSQGTVDGDRFRTLTALQIGQPPVVVAVELGRSHTSIVEEARDPWYVWTVRGGTVAAVCVVLYIVTAIFFAFLAALERRPGRRQESAVEVGAILGRKERVRAASSVDRAADVPAYMRPGFQDEVEARREVETALEKAQQERAELVERLRRTEAELTEARRLLADRETSGHVLPTR